MKENKAKHTIEDLSLLQNLPLDLKIKMSKARIRAWINEYGEDGVYISFSGGKDSTVLLDLVRQDYPDIEAVFCDTGLEYPEVRNFVKGFDNVTWLKPKMNFKEVISKYGYPLPSKRQAQSIREFKTTNSEKLARIRLFGDDKGKALSAISKRHLSLCYAPFSVSEQCCNVMKKRPANQYATMTNKNHMTGEMASESVSRNQNWLQHGCNMYDNIHPKSTPMAFWTEQDVLQYIKQRNLPIASVYGDVISEDLFDCKLKTTGTDRTGCMFCMFGVHMEKGENRFQRMKRTHPAQYKYCIGGGEYRDGLWKPSREGLGMWKVLDYVGIKTD